MNENNLPENNGNGDKEPGNSKLELLIKLVVSIGTVVYALVELIRIIKN